MVQSTMTKIECAQTSGNYGRFIVEPLEPGFGVTLGNALRRVLLSSLPGAAITAVRIEGIQHEFSTIPHVKEDMMTFLLNVRQIRLRSLSQQPSARLSLNVAGEGPVCAGDIEPSADFEVVNPEAHLAMLDSADAKLNAEFYVEQGKGYERDEPSDSLPIGVLPTDAFYSPIRRANFAVEKTRVGQQSNLDRLILEVWTDGTIPPDETLIQAAQILVEQLAVFSKLGHPVPTEVHAEPSDLPIELLELSSRTLNCLKRNRVTTVGGLLEKSREELKRMKGLGQASLREIQNNLEAKGFTAKADEEEAALPEEEKEVTAKFKAAGFKVKKR